MAKKPARKSRSDANGSDPKPTKAIEPKPDRFSNPLLTDPVIHADLNPLFDAVVMVSVWTQAIARCYPDLLALKESRGLPKPEEWPDSPALDRSRAQHAEWMQTTREEYAAKGESVAVAEFLEPEWTEKMSEWSGFYRDWCAAIAKAKELAKSPAVAAIMDAGESRPAHRWTTQMCIDLDNLAGALHPSTFGGVDGLGVIRFGLPPLPTNFGTHAEAVGKRISELRSIPVSAVPPTPTASVSPELLDRLQRAAAVDPTPQPPSPSARRWTVGERLAAIDEQIHAMRETNPERFDEQARMAVKRCEAIQRQRLAAMAEYGRHMQGYITGESAMPSEPSPPDLFGLSWHALQSLPLDDRRAVAMVTVSAIYGGVTGVPLADEPVDDQVNNARLAGWW